jgi:multiple sugar transport system substrate-binding protein
MIPEQREALDEIIVKIRSGRMTRRTFLERAIAVGLTSSAAVSLLEACGGTSNSTGGNGQTTNLVWQTENDNSGTYPAIVDAFNKSNKGIHVTWHNGPSGTGDILTIYDNVLRARSGSIDVMSIDVVYPAEFASNGWTVDLTSMWPASERANYLQGPIKSCTYQGKVVAAPLRTDLGILYYRKDIVSTAPQSYDQLVSLSKTNASKAKYGYVWQGSQYEGLVCNFVEVLGGYGGTVLDPNNSKSVTVNSPQGQQALAEMVSWVGTISPISVTTLTEEPCRQAFQNGDAIFMRNWPYAYSLGNNASQSKVAGKFDITSLPYGGSSTTGHSCTGGWNMAINAFSKNPDAAWTFMQYMLGATAQKTLAIQGSFTPALQSVYSDPEVQQKQPLFTKLAPILQNALPRPVSPVYPDLSNIIQNHVHQALTKTASVTAALSALQTELQALVNK